MSDKNMQKPDHDSFDELLKSALSEKIEEEIPEKEDTEYSFSEEFLTGIAESIENADSIAVAEERHGRSRRKRPEGEKVSQDKAQSAQEAMNGKIIPLAGLGRHKRMIVNAASLLIVLGLGVFIVKEGGIRFAGSSAEQANTEAAAETPEAGQPSAAAYQAETAPEEAAGETGASREALQDSGENEGTQALDQEPESSYTADTRVADTGDTEEADRDGSSGSRTDRDGDDAEGEGSGSASVRETASSSRQSSSGSGSSTGSRQSSSGSSTGSRNSGSTSGGSSSGTSGRTSGTSGQRETTAAPAQTGQTGAAAADTGAGSTGAGTTAGTQAAEGAGSGTGAGTAGTTAENETAATTAAAEMQESQAAGTAPGALPETGLANPIVPVLNAEALWELLEIRIDVPEELLAQETDSQKPQYNAIGGEAAEIRYESKALEEEVIYRAMKAERGEDPSGVYYVFDPAREESFTSTVSTKDGQLRRVEFLLRRTAGAAPDGTLVTWTIDRTNYSLWVAPSSGKETEIKNEAKALLEAAWEDALKDFTVSDLEQLKPDGPQG